MTATRQGKPGIRWTRDGAYFSVFSNQADQLELCLFDETGAERERLQMHPSAGGMWTVYLSGCQPGQLYGYRAHGPYAPEKGLRFNPAKLLVDPWALALHGQFQWSDAVFDYLPGNRSWKINPQDSAGFVPRSVALKPGASITPARQRPSWSELVIYEANVRGYTMRHPDLDEDERGRFRGLANGQIVDYLRSLGITAIELMPVQSFIDEQFLARRGLRNAWGYNSLNFFTPQARYAAADAVGEFRDMVRSLHDAGIEVILDVVFNHTAEGDERGPSLSMRGLDHLAYYRVERDQPERCINDTGTGNTINADHPRVQQLVVEALSYWHRHMGVDGFRFDLAPVLGRTEHGFDPGHPLLELISSEPRLQTARLVAEPWDPGPGGYQLGCFPTGWSEWNDRFRDSLRRFWRGDPHQAGELAARLSGSTDLFPGRGPSASVNFVTAHDGFTLSDLVSYQHRHNEANGEANRDGHEHNYSCNHGIEGATDDARVQAARRRHRLNLLGTLLLSRGIPMLLAGDEFGHTQHGNNNAYAQDNATTWLDWGGLQEDPAFTQQVRELIRLRRQLYPLSQNMEWRTASGGQMSPNDWHSSHSMQVQYIDLNGNIVALLLLNASHEAIEFQLFGCEMTQWQLAFSSDQDAVHDGAQSFVTGARSMAFLTSQCK